MQPSVSPSPLPTGRPKLWVTLLQALVGVAAIVWLVRSGKLDVTLLREQLSMPTVLSWMGLYAGINLLHTLRWQLFCRQAGLPLGFGTALRLMGIGLFWGTFTPGLVGIDISRGYTLARRFPGQAGPAVLTVVADRFLIIVATLLVGLVGIPLAWPLASRYPVLLLIAGGAGAAGLLLLALLAVMVWVPLQRVSWLKPVLEGRLAKTYAAICLFREAPALLAVGLGLGLVAQGASIGLIGLLVGHLGVTWGDLTLIVPIGWHAMSLPVAPAGLGVGQVAFDQLFVWAGSKAGAGATATTAFHACLVAFHLVAGLSWLIRDRKSA